MALTLAALVLLLIASISAPLTALCMYSSRYSLPAIKYMRAEYAYSLWSVLSRPAHLLKGPIVITSGNIFLLVNLIIFFLFISMHLQHHAPAAAAKKKAVSRKRSQQHAQKLITTDKGAAAPCVSETLSSSACAAALRPLQASMETLQATPRQIHGRGESFHGAAAAEIGDGASMKSLNTEAGAMQESAAATRTEQIVLQEDGRLRLIEAPSLISSPTVDHIADAKDSDAEKIVLDEDGRLRLIEPTNGSGTEKVVVGEDEMLRIVETINVPDEEEIVLEEDGRLRLRDKPLPSPRFTSRPEKSLSDDCYSNHSNNTNNDSAHNQLNDTRSLNYAHNQANDDTLSLNPTPNHNPILNPANGNTFILDQSLNPHDSHYSNPSNKSSKGLARQRSIRAGKKSESLDATWRAIHHKKGNSDRDHNKHLIRQSSRKDFKPISRGSRGVMMMREQYGHNNVGRVRREPSLGAEELNARVESFIARFNEQIRVERQQSILSFMQMVDRGA